MPRLGIGLELEKAQQCSLASIPYKSDALFWLDGSVNLAGTALVDKINGWEFPLSAAYDWNLDIVTKIIPYKTAIALSAPANGTAAATAIQAKDVNNFWYASNGTANSIPFISFFGDLDYEHKGFAQNVAQTTELLTLIEKTSAGVKNIVLYNTAKAGAALTACNTFYSVPNELSDANAVWVSPTGNDATGAGTKASPYRNLSKVVSTTKTIYLKTGSYNLTADINFAGATPITIVGLGYAECNGSAYNIQFHPVSNVTGLIHTDTTTRDHPLFFYANTTWNRCKITKSNVTAGNQWGYMYATNISFELNDCIINMQSIFGLMYRSQVMPSFVINRCYGKLGTGSATNNIVSAVVSYNKFTSYFVTPFTATTVSFFGNTFASAIPIGSTTTSILFKSNTVTGAMSIVSTTAELNIFNNTFVGNLQVNNSSDTYVYSNTVTGILSIATNTTILSCHTNTIVGSLVVYNVTASIHVYENSIVGIMTIGSGTVSLVENNTIIDGKLTVRASNNGIVRGNYVHASYSNKTTAHLAFEYLGTPGTTYTGIEIVGNTFIGSQNEGTIAVVGSDSEATQNCINGAKIHYNKIVNDWAGAAYADQYGRCHNLFCHSGINYSVKYNEIILLNGHGIVVKAAGQHYTTTDSHISYNVFKCIGESLNAIWNRAAYGVIFANNTIVNFHGLRIYMCDDNTMSWDNSLLCINNHCSLGGNTTYYGLGANITVRNNTINLNGYTLAVGSPPANNYSIATAIDLDGIPTSKIEHAETVAGSNNTGLASDYSIPSAPTYQAQGATWQNGAVILP